MKNQHRIYMIECVPTGKRYIGSASFVVQRFSRHRQDLRRGTHMNRHLQSAWTRYSEQAFRFIELECVLDKSRLIEAEQWWLDLLKPEFNVLRIAASPLGTKQSDETKRKRSAALKRYWSGHRRICTPEQRRRISESQRGKTRVFTDAHRRALSISAAGRVLSADTRKKIGDANRGSKRQFSNEHKAAIKAAWAIRKQSTI